MRTIIAGSRNVTPEEFLAGMLGCSWLDDITEVVCGKAAGVDTFGEEWAKECNIPVNYFPAKWGLFGRSAGPRRNLEMAQNADALIAIWKDNSSGTKNMIGHAKNLNLKIYVYIV